MNYRSESIDLIMAALAKAQGGYKKLVPNEVGPRGRFCNLASILHSARESLSKNELSFYQYIDLKDEGDGAALLRSVLGHSSGQYISSVARIFSGKTDRATGASYEYHKRQQALLLLGIAPSDNDPDFHDDDGASNADEVIIEEIKKPKAEKRNDEHILHEKISTTEYQNLMIELEGYPELVRDIQKTYQISTLADMRKEDYWPSVMRIRKIKEAEEKLRKK